MVSAMSADEQHEEIWIPLFTEVQQKRKSIVYTPRLDHHLNPFLVPHLSLPSTCFPLLFEAIQSFPHTYDRIHAPTTL